MSDKINGFKNYILYVKITYSQNLHSTHSLTHSLIVVVTTRSTRPSLLLESGKSTELRIFLHEIQHSTDMAWNDQIENGLHATETKCSLLTLDSAHF